MAADVSIGSFPFIGADGVGFHRLPSGGQFVQHRHVQIAVQNQRQGAGDGGGGHHQQVGILPLGGQAGPLRHTETVLFIGDHQTQSGELDVVADEGMGTHDKIHFACGDGLLHPPLLGGRKGAGQQPHSHGISQ